MDANQSHIQSDSLLEESLLQRIPLISNKISTKKERILNRSIDAAHPVGLENTKYHTKSSLGKKVSNKDLQLLDPSVVLEESGTSKNRRQDEARSNERRSNQITESQSDMLRMSFDTSALEAMRQKALSTVQGAAGHPNTVLTGVNKMVGA